MTRRSRAARARASYTRAHVRVQAAERESHSRAAEAVSRELPRGEVRGAGGTADSRNVRRRARAFGDEPTQREGSVGQKRQELGLWMMIGCVEGKG
eukprot:6204232-Pleurochrysis_carterae.AAC.2